MLNFELSEPYASLLIYTLLGLLVSGLVASPGILSAEELKEGTVLSKKNLDQHLTDTFEDQKIEDLLTDKVQYMIENWNLKIRLGSREDYIIPAQRRATREHKGEASYQPESRSVKNYSAGVPFTDVQVGNSNAGDKAIYNAYVADPMHNYYDCRGKNVMVSTDADRGVYRTPEAVKQVYFMRGRFTKEGHNHTEGDGSIFQKKFLYFTDPYDLRGIGSYIIRYWDGRSDDSWAYLRSIRRIRRTAGSSWKNRFPTTVYLNEDASIMEADPRWYSSHKLKDVKTLLTPVSIGSDTLPIYHEDTSEQKQFEMIDTNNPPHWNWNPETVEWQPRKQYIVESIPPDDHPYGKKIIYIDAQHWMRLTEEVYDKKGEFWQFHGRPFAMMSAADGLKAVGEMGVQWFDFKEERANFVSIGSECAYNSRGIKGEDFSVDQLRKVTPPKRGQ